jgi:ABC-type transporter Mla subunit MlaD
MRTRAFRKGAVGKPRTRAFLTLVGVGGILAAAVSAFIGYQASYKVPGRSYYNLKAEFTHAENLANHYEVRIGGLRAGKILHPRVSHGKALVDVRLLSEFKPLLSDSQLRIRLRSAVGVRYVEIVPGTKGRPLADGDTLPVSQTSRPVALDQVLGTFDPSTREQTQELLTQLGAGAAGRGEDVNDAFARAPGFLSDLGDVSGTITARPGAVRNFVRSAGAAANAFDPVRVQLAGGFSPEAAALRPFSERADAVGGTLAEAPTTLAELRTGLPSVRRLVGEVGGLAREGRPALAAAPGALDETSRLLRAAQPALRRADRTLALAQRAVDPSLTLLAQVRPVLPAIDTALDALAPTVRTVGDHACDLSNAMTGWTHMMTWGDSYSNFIRFFVAPHGDQLRGGTQTTDFTHSTPYAPPCRNDVSEAGELRPTQEEYIKSLGGPK